MSVPSSFSLSPRHPVTPSPRIAVIGAGIVGAAIAHRLAEKGIAAILLDRSEPGSGATGASLALVSATEQLPRAFFDLSFAAMEDYRRLAWKLAPAPWYHVDGNLLWFSDPASAVALREQVQRLQAWGYAADLLPAREVQADLEPGLAIANPETPVACFPEVAWVDPHALTHRLVEGVRNAGGRVLTGPDREVVAIAVAGGRVSSVTLRGGQMIPVSAVVNAAGVDAARIAALVGRRLPVLAPRSLAVRAALPDEGDPLHHPLRTDGIAMRRDGPGHILIVAPADPADMRPGTVAIDDPRVADVLARCAAVAPALAAAQPVEALVAAWPIIEDGLPCVGGIPGIPGYFEAVTDYGVTLAPLIARSLTDEIQGQPVNPLLEPFRTDRFPMA